MSLRKPITKLLSFTALAGVMMTTPASAQSIEDLQKQINALQKQINKMAEEKKKEKKSSVKVKWKGAPEISSKDGKNSMKLRGRLFVDYASVSHKDAAGNNIPSQKINGTEIREARLGIQGKVAGDFNYQFEAGFIGSSVQMKDTFVQYSGLKPLKIKVGHFKQFNSLESLTSSSYLTFKERGSFVTAFGLGRRVGLAAITGGDNWTASAGYFFDGWGSTNSSLNDTNLTSARITYSPAIHDDAKVHVGASYFRRSVNGSAYDKSYKQRAFDHQDTARFNRSSTFTLDSETFFGLEFATVMGPFGVQSEWAWMKNSLDTSETDISNDPTYNGGYVELSYFVTGESRSYSAKKGSFGRVKVKNPVTSGGSGAVQLSARYDRLNLTHNEGSMEYGNTQNSYILGMNWHLNNYTRVMVNYSNSKIKDMTGTLNKVDAFGLRIQTGW